MSEVNVINEKFMDNLDEYLENAWLELGDVRRLKLDNPMLSKDWEDNSKLSELIIQTCREPEYLHFFIKYVLNIDILPYQAAILQTLWNKPFPMLIATRGGAKSFTIAVYCVVRAVLHQGCRIAVVGASLRQSMVIFNYIEQIWSKAPILRDICGGEKGKPSKGVHMAEWKCGHSRIMFLPLGDGNTIRGQRANIVIADEFHSISESVFETVVRGFASTKSDGVFASVQTAAKQKLMKQEKLDVTEEDIRLKINTMLGTNQIVIAGTAYYQFNHFYKYFKYYKAIITSGGDKEYIKRNFPDMNISDRIDPRDYAIIRIPYDAMPPGMMDENILLQGRAIMDPAIFDMEYSCIFPSDSEGFYPASYIHNATCPLKRDGKDITFRPCLDGRNGRRYVMGIDPASEDDHFAICIIELNEDYRGLVYQWSTNRKKFEKAQREGLIDTTIKDYHTFCIKHIRSLVRRFHIDLIVCDAAGGGSSVREGLKDPDKMILGDRPILDMDDENNIYEDGSRILKMIEFSSYSWRRESHYALKKDILDRILLFPYYDAADIEVSKLEGLAYDTLEDCYLEITECKTETTMIQHSQTGNNTEKWDVPDLTGVSSSEHKKKLKKDRFTSLLLANWGARLLGEITPGVNSQLYKSVRRNSIVPNNSATTIKPRYSQSGNGRRIYY